MKLHPLPAVRYGGQTAAADPCLLAGRGMSVCAIREWSGLRPPQHFVERRGSITTRLQHQHPRAPPPYNPTSTTTQPSHCFHHSHPPPPSIMASTGSSRGYPPESSRRGTTRDTTTRPRSNTDRTAPPPSQPQPTAVPTGSRRSANRAGTGGSIIGEKRTTERTHITETTITGRRAKSPSREKNASPNVVSGGGWGTPLGTAPTHIPSLHRPIARESPQVENLRQGRKRANEARLSNIFERGTAPWNPEATLIPPTTAPLASRISIPPLASQMPPSKRPPPLEHMNLELQEASILEDLLFVFMACFLQSRASCSLPSTDTHYESTRATKVNTSASTKPTILHSSPTVLRAPHSRLPPASTPPYET